MKPEEHLPGKITSITPQKNNKRRYSIFVDETFLIGISDTTLLKRKLKVKSTITPALYKKLQRDEGYNKAKNYFLKLLGRREHARRELARKAGRKDFSPEMIEQILYELEEKDYINDARFAKKYAADKNNLKKWGPNKIAAHLRKKGVNKGDTQRAISVTFESTDLEARLKELILKRKKHFGREANKLKRKQKIANYLLQKGYTSSSIFNLIDELMLLIEEPKEIDRKDHL
ncbi:MAG TPA: regulatory protein RecX [Balneolaceae bacterium]|nr:regulatory protein RecX [Balneolaceae bacterium]